jgi:hypothetical protein
MSVIAIIKEQNSYCRVSEISESIWLHRDTYADLEIIIRLHVLKGSDRPLSSAQIVIPHEVTSVEDFSSVLLTRKFESGYSKCYYPDGFQIVEGQGQGRGKVQTDNSVVTIGSVHTSMHDKYTSVARISFEPPIYPRETRLIALFVACPNFTRIAPGFLRLFEVYVYGFWAIQGSRISEYLDKYVDKMCVINVDAYHIHIKLPPDCAPTKLSPEPRQSYLPPPCQYSERFCLPLERISNRSGIQIGDERAKPRFYIRWSFRDLTVASRQVVTIEYKQELPLPSAISSDEIYNICYLIAKSVLAGSKLILFSGAGLSKSAGIPLGDELRDMVLQESLVDWSKSFPGLRREEITLEMAVSHVCKTLPLKQTSFFSHVMQLMAKAEPSSAHFEIAGAISKGFISDLITTNWDELLEKACRQQKLRYRAFARTSQFDKASGLRRRRRQIFPVWIVKLHGTVSNPDSIPTHESEVQELPAPKARLIKNLLYGAIVIVVGYSWRDRDILKLFSDEQILENTDIFWVSPFPLSEGASTVLESHCKVRKVSLTRRVLELKAEDFLPILLSVFTKTKQN